MAPSSSQDGRHRRRRAVERPIESPECDHRRAHRALSKHHELPEAQAPVAGRIRERPEHGDVGADDKQHAPQHRLLAQPCRVVLQRVQPRAASHETIDRPGREAEETQLLRRRRIDREPERVVGVALRGTHFVGVAIAPDRALAQQPMRGQPGAAQDNRDPPGVREEHHGTREAAHHFDEPACDEVHRDAQRRTGHAEVEIARNGQVGGERRILEVRHPRRAHTGFGQPVVEPCGSSIAEIRADSLVNGSEHLEQAKHAADKGQRNGEIVAALHGAHEQTHRDGEHRREHAAENEHDPPGDGEKVVRLRQHAEELPLITLTQTPQHQSPNCKRSKRGQTLVTSRARVRPR